MELTIVTRFGIGVSDPHVFAHNFNMLRNGLFKCLVSQTCRKFNWILISDVNLSPSVRGKIEDLFEPHINFHLRLIDPVKDGTLTPRLSHIFPDGIPSGGFAISRIDDDDLITKHFVQIIVETIENNNERPLIITLSDGLEVSSADNICVESHRPYLGLGLTVVCDDDFHFNVYEASHFKIFDFLSERKPTTKSVEVRSEAGVPHWAYIRRIKSDNHAPRSEIKMAKSAYKIAEDGYWAPVIRRSADNWGLTLDEFRHFIEISGFEERSPKLVQLEKSEQLISAKKRLLSLARARRKEHGEDPTYKALLMAMYAL